MTPACTTFVVRSAVDRTRAIALLTDSQVDFEPEGRVMSTLLDSFDGRLHRAGVHLDLDELPGRTLALSRGSTSVAITVAPRFAGDVIPELAGGISAALGPRRLLPRLRRSATRTVGIVRAGAGDSRMTVTLHERIRVLDPVRRSLPGALIEVCPVRGPSKAAARVVRALATLGLEQVNGDAAVAVGRAADVDLGGFKASPTVQLDAAMPAIQGLQAVLANLADTIDANWQGAIDDLDIEFLHELRVATRRSRSVLAHGHDVLPAWVVADARQRLAWVGRLTGPARDLDVYVTEWDAYVAPLGADALNRLTPALAILESRRAAAHRALEDGLRSDTAIQHMVTWRHQLTRLAALEPRGPHADRVLGRVVAGRIVTAHRRLIERGGRIDAATPAARLHALRKDGKELRYLVECFGGLLAEGPRKRYVRRLSALQDVLGAHQDAEIHLGVAHDLAATLHAGGADHTTMLALGRLCERLAQAQLRSRRAFARQFDDYRSDKTVDALDALLCHLRS